MLERFRTTALLVLAVASVGGVALVGGSLGCEGTTPKPPPPPRYETLPPKQLPEFLKGTVLERMDHLNPEPLQVSNYGLVVNLPGTGDGTAPSIVREYIIKEMVKRGFGNIQREGFEHVTPEKVLDDPKRRAAIVRVDAFMPPGIRKGQTFDVVVSALSESGVTSLAGGMLYRTDLKIGAADARNPAGVIEVQGKCQGPVFINPSLTLNPQASTTDKNASRISRRQGVVLAGGISDKDQPLVLKMRAPQRSVIRQIQYRINQFYQDPLVADAKDEGIMHLKVPPMFHGDWERFIGVTMHLYLDGTPEVLTVRAKRLAEEAVKPDAPLQNISFAWEGIGEVALPAIEPLMSSKYPEDVQFAAARAAAFIGDIGAQSALMRMASTPTHQFQVDAVRTLGGMRPSPSIKAMLKQLLNSQSALVRVAAYKVLAGNEYYANAFFQQYMPRQGQDERFSLDVVPGLGPTVIHATRSGIPRIAILGQPAHLVTPITFTALDNRLSITSNAGQPGVTVFYRQEGTLTPIKVTSRTDLSELIGWLGGAAYDQENQIDLTYGEIVAIVQALADQKLLLTDSQPALAANFMLEEQSDVASQVETAKPLEIRSRPQGGEVERIPTPGALPAGRPTGAGGAGTRPSAMLQK